MRSSVITVLTRLAILTVWLGNSGYANAAPVSAPKAPAVVVDLAKIGWTPPQYESNRGFFKDYSIAKLESVDHNTRIFFLSEDVIAVYHTKQEGKNWRTARRSLEAFFIRAKDGSLVSTKTWPVSLRKSGSDLRDSEARLFPLYDGHFLVFANGTISLYAGNLELQKQKKLEPTSPADFWSAQTVDDGKEIFLRHESRSKQRVTYSWLASDTLEVDYQLPPYPWVYMYHGFPMQGVVFASKDAVFASVDSGIGMIGRDQRFKTICDDPLCRGSFRVMSSRHIGVSGKDGLGIVDMDHGLEWSRSVQALSDHGVFDFGEIRSDSSGTRLAVWVIATKKRSFDGVALKNLATLLVYNRSDPKGHPQAIPIKPIEGQWDYAFSPSGEKLVLFDGAKLRVYFF
jgi:hypothetical protein